MCAKRRGVLAVACLIPVLHAGAASVLETSAAPAAKPPVLTRVEEVRKLSVADDIYLLALPSWWTTGRVIGVVGVMSVLVVAGFGWLAALRHACASRQS